jgi:hypothetical protein
MKSAPAGTTTVWFNNSGKVVSVLVDRSESEKPPREWFGVPSAIGGSQWCDTTVLNIPEEGRIYGTYPAIPQYNFRELQINQARGDAKWVFNAISAAITQRDTNGETLVDSSESGVSYRIDTTDFILEAIIPEHLAEIPPREFTADGGWIGTAVPDKDNAFGVFPELR